MPFFDFAGPNVSSLNQLGKALSEDTLGTRSLATDPLAYEQLEYKTSPPKSNIGQSALIATMDP
jgi:hypothetical protein